MKERKAKSSIIVTVKGDKGTKGAEETPRSGLAFVQCMRLRLGEVAFLHLIFGKKVG